AVGRRQQPSRARLMSDHKNSAASYIAELGTPSDEDAFHRLIELGSGAIPVLMATFRDERRPSVRGRLIEVISQFRQVDTVEFLEGALSDSDTSVWKAALDGLVTLGGPAVIGALH